jgi:hypothetical protein
MPKEYIEREAALKAMSQAIQDRTWSMDDFDVMIKMEDNVAELPAADVEPVRHGEWFLLDECANEGVYCSVCHKKVYKTHYANQKLKSKFCPNCGAKMDGGKK